MPPSADDAALQSIVSKGIWLGIALATVLTMRTALTVYQNFKADNENSSDEEEDSPKTPLKQNRNSSMSRKSRLRSSPSGILESAREYNPNKPKDGQSQKFHSLNPTKLDSNERYSIVFTGGPCAGKTTSISHCAEKLKELGYSVICIPEAASLIFSSGGVLDMSTYSQYAAVEFQTCVMRLQICLEDIFSKIVAINAGSNPIYSLCDRGLMDGSAYLSEDQWQVLLNEFGLFDSDIKERYDLVIQMATAAEGAEKFFTLGNNAARSESIQESKALEFRLRKAWKDHPKYYLITNECETFNEKIKMAENICLKIGGTPINTKFSRKYLLNNKTDVFRRLLANYSTKRFKITDSFLENVSLRKKINFEKDIEKEVVFLRKRVD